MAAWISCLLRSLRLSLIHIYGKADILNINLHDVLTHAEKDLFITDGNKQLMVQGNKGDVVNLSDLLPDNSDPGNWTNACLLYTSLSAALDAGDKVLVSVDGGATWQEALVDGDKWAYVDTQGHSADWTILTRVVDAAGNYTCLLYTSRCV